MAIVVNTKTYSADIPSSKDSLPYFGPNRTVSSEDKIDLYRTAAIESASYSGVARSRVKLSRTLTLTNAKTASGLATFDLAFNVPVGAASADIDGLLSDLAAALGQSWVKDLVKSHDLNA